jgi:hypothetical protein
VIVKPVLASVGPAKGSSRSRSAAHKLPASGVVTLNEEATTFRFTNEELADVLEMFGSLNAPEIDPEVGADIVLAAESKRADGREISPSTLESLAVIESNPALKAAVNAALVKKRAKRAAEAAARANGAVSPRTLAAIAAAEKSSPPMLFKGASGSSNSSISPRTRAAIAALQAESSSPKKKSSPKGRGTRRATTAAAKPKPAAGGAGAPSAGPVRRSERLRRATQKKKSSSSHKSSSAKSSNSLSPNTIAALLESMKLGANNA